MTNTAVRTISGAGFVVVTLGCLLFSPYLYAGFVILIMLFMLSEFYTMAMGKDQYKFSRFLASLAGVILFGLVFSFANFGLNVKFVSLAMIPIMIVMINSLFVKDKTEFGQFAFIYTGLLYIAIPLALSNLIAFRHGEFSGILLICFFIIIWCSDTGAYVAGIMFGQKPNSRKLCPKISPKKSWYGFWGGMLFASLAAIVLHLCGLLNIPVWHCIILGVIMHVAGVFGDLFESMWKRFFNVKDSGNIIPGHGGMLDRFDSTLFAVPFGAIYLALFNLL